jgi:hypothetical protein
MDEEEEAKVEEENEEEEEAEEEDDAESEEAEEAACAAFAALRLAWFLVGLASVCNSCGISCKNRDGSPDTHHTHKA